MFRSLTLGAAARLLHAREATSVDLARTALEALGGYVVGRRGRAAIEQFLADAHYADAELAQGGLLGRLHGVPIGVADGPVGAASLTGAGGVVLPLSALAADAVAAVAAGALPATITVDTAGTVQRSAATSGVCALSLTHGAEKGFGQGPEVPGSADGTVGGLVITARVAQDCDTLLSILPPVGCGSRGPAVAGVRLAVDAATTRQPSVATVLTGLIESLARRGAAVSRLELPWFGAASAAHYVITTSEQLATDFADLGRNWDRFPRARRQTLAAALAFGADDYVQAQRVRRVVQRAAERAFHDIDVIVSATRLQPDSLRDDETAIANLTGAGTVLERTGYWDLIGYPAFTVPCGCDGDGRRLAVQVSGPPGAEATVLRVGVVVDESIAGRPS